jgi:hypothetical protein
MASQQPQRGIHKLISDPYREWNRVDVAEYDDFGQWLDAELLLLEARYAGWETPGYGHWRSLYGGTRQRPSHEAEAEAAE